MSNREAVDEDLVRAHLPLVGHVVGELMSRLPAHADRDDLSGAGLEGLVQAARSWRPDAGVPFAAFARTRVRGALLDHLRSIDWASRGARSRQRTLAESSEQLAAALGRTPTTTELAETLGVSTAEVHSVREETHRSYLTSLSEPVGLREDGSSATAEDTLVADQLDPEQHVLLAERIGALRSAIDALPERVREAVRGHYLEEEPMADIAVRLGVTESRVSQLRAEGVALLRLSLVETPAGLPRQLSPREAAYAASVAATADTRTHVRTGAAVLAGRYSSAGMPLQQPRRGTAAAYG